MAKSSDQLEDQVKAVNEELRRLELPEVTSAVEKALVDSAYNQMGTGNVLQQLGVLIPALIAVITVFVTGGVRWEALLVGVLAGLVLMLFFFFPFVMPTQQTAKAIELVIMHRVAQSARGETEP